MTSPAFIVMKAADQFANPPTVISELWQTDFTYLKVTGWRSCRCFYPEVAPFQEACE